MQKLTKSVLLLIFLTGCQMFTPIEKRLLSDNENLRSKALAKVEKMSEAKKAEILPLLLEGLKEEDSRVAGWAADALVAMKEPAVSPLIETLHQDDLYVRLIAISSLARLGALSTPAVSPLVELLADPHPLIREEAAQALGRIGDSSSSVVDALRHLSQKDPVDTVRISGHDALENLGIIDSTPRA